MEGDHAEQAIEQLKAQLEEDAVRESIRRKSELIQSGTAQKEQEKESPAKNVVNLFSKSNKRPEKPLFGLNENEGVNLFKMGPSKNLFNQSSSEGAKNIFNLAQKPAVANEDFSKHDQNENSKDNEGNEEGSPSKSSTFKTEPDQKVMKYEYKQESQKICEFNLKKFKLAAQTAKQQIYVTIEKPHNQSGILYINIRNSLTKIVLFNGVLMKNISLIENFLQKPDILKFYVIRKNKQTDESECQQSKMTKEFVKLQFMNGEEAENFKNKVMDNY